MHYVQSNRWLSPTEATWGTTAVFRPFDNVSSGQENLAVETATSGAKARDSGVSRVLKLRIFIVRNGGLCSDSRDFSRQGFIPNSRLIGFGQF